MRPILLRSYHSFPYLQLIRSFTSRSWSRSVPDGSFMMEKVRHLEGVFAVNKPPGLSSAAVLREIQEHFNPSETFKPWLTAEAARAEYEDSRSNPHHRRKKKFQNRHSRVKIGHGGTLDPAATGVLICGLGKGTKALSGFLGCTKEYETVVLFGVATDTYDMEGKVVKRASVEGITKETIEEALSKFRGNIMQRPPIFSALSVQGKRLYEYARSGQAVPVAIEERPMKVEKMELVEFLPPGSHQYKQPTEEVEAEDKAVAKTLLDAASSAPGTTIVDLKRKRESSPVSTKDDASKKLRTENGESVPTTTTTISTDSQQAEESNAKEENIYPAARLRMTVSSGFYVRSLCHDLGIALGSLAHMASLVRTRQERFSLEKGNVLSFEDLEKGEEVWSGKVLGMLDEWNRSQDEGQDQGQNQGQSAGQSQGQGKSQTATTGSEGDAKSEIVVEGSALESGKKESE